jgi:hypothetical protein
MKKYLSVLAMTVAFVTVAAPVAQADSPGCVSKGEYAHVHRGMRMSQVHRLFDTDGRVDLSIGRVSIRKYRPCPRHSLVKVSYRRGRVSAKAALWLAR